MSTHRTPYFVLIGLALLSCLLISSCSSQPGVEQTGGSLPRASSGNPDSTQETQSNAIESASPKSDHGQPSESPADSDSAAQGAEPDSPDALADQARIERLVERGKNLLRTEVASMIDDDFFTPEWYFEDEIARLDEDAFPDWARAHFEICMYWELPMTDDLTYIQRKPGESRWFQITGKCWGWILLGEEGYHILELAHEWPQAVEQREQFSGARGVFIHVDDWHL